MNIQMVDLTGQYQKIKADVDKEIQEVIDSTQFIKGGKVKDFQVSLEQYLDVKHVIPVGNGTDALQLALMALDLKPGDEVITPTFTFIATAEVVALLGLTPVVVDVEWDTMCISIDSLKKAITPKTKAIVPVHLFGQNSNMEAIMEIAKEHDLYVIEDACQSIGADYKYSDGREAKSGCMGNVGCTSFFPSKNLGCYGDGGALFTNDDALAQKLRVLSNHGMEVRYHHDLIGVNSRLDSIQAAVLLAKLPHLDEYSAARNAAASYYNTAFAGIEQIETPVTAQFTNHVFHQYTLKLKGVDRAKLQAYLSERGIPAMIYYPIPLHMQKAYNDPRYKEGDFPVAEALAASVLSLPMHTEMTEEQLEYITRNVIEGIKQQ